MRYWWVNHKQTFRFENKGNYIWSPITRSDGGHNVFYENLTQVQYGDKIISFANAQIKAIGIIESGYQKRSRPLEFGDVVTNWDIEGYYVPVFWNNLSTTIRPSEIIDEIRNLLPQQYSPIRQENGYGNQGCYLAEISEGFFQNIIQRAIALNNDLSFFEETSKEVEESEELDRLQNDQVVPETEKQQVILARKGQGLFRNQVIIVESGKCRVTGCNNPKYLIASHIKPWKLSTNEERLDGNNGLLLSPHIDKLFDKRHISFNDNGMITYYTDAAKLALDNWGIDCQQNYGPFTDKQKKYLAEHRLMCSNRIH